MMATWSYKLLFFGVLILSAALLHAEEDEKKDDSNAAAEGGEETEEPRDTEDPAEGGEETEEASDTEDPSDDDGSSVVKEDNDVLVLTKDNFDDVVMKKDIILVEFYAPWCGHCKTLKPEYEKAAKILKNSNIPLGKVDATEEPDLAQRYDVSGYPTLKFFKRGEPFAYDGPREANGIVEFMAQRGDPNWKPAPETVITLTKDNFTEVINREAVMLVEFYAPWCGHCKTLAPKYEKAAQELIEGDSPVLLAKVDATLESDIAKEYGVQGFPTLKVFRKGKAYEYKGDQQESWGIVEYMTKQKGEASPKVSTVKEMAEHLSLEEEDISPIGFFAEEDKKFDIYNELTIELREDYEFTHTFDKDVMAHYKAKPGTLVIYYPERFHTKHEKPSREFIINEDTTVEELKTFLTSHDIPLVGALKKDNREKRYKDKFPVVMFFYTVKFDFDNIKNTQLWRRKVADIANDFRDMTFVVADEEEFPDLMKKFGFDDSGEEMNMGIFDAKKRAYPMEAMDEWDSDLIREFIESFKKGELKERIQSQPIPRKQSGPVRVVVGKTFQDIVLDESKDVLIELYAPWCGHCKQLAPVYKKLAKKYKDDKNLVIAKMDATANDRPSPYNAEGFPTIFFSPSNDKENPIKFEGGNRELSDFVSFMEKHATVSLGKGKEKTEL